MAADPRQPARTDLAAPPRSAWRGRARQAALGAALAALTACAERSPLAGGDATADDRAVKAIAEAYAARDCAAVEGLAASYETTSVERHQAVTYMFGRCFYLTGRYPQAATTLARISNLTPPGRLTDDALYFLGRSHYRLKAWPEAEAALLTYRERFDHQPYQDDALYFLGKIRLRVDEPDAALVIFDALMNDERSSPIRRAGAAYQSGKAEVALIRLDPDAADAHRLAARAWFERILEDHLESIYADNAQYQLAALLYDEGRLLEAEAALLDFEARWPRSALSHLSLYKRGRIAEKLGDAQRALTLYEAYEATFAGASFADNTRYRSGRVLLREAERLDDEGSSDATVAYAAAELTLASALTDFPDTLLAHRIGYFLGRARYAREAFSTAISAFALTLEHPESIYADNASYYTGRCLYRLERYEDARARFALLPQTHPDSPYLDDAAYFSARSSAQQARWVEAAEAFEAFTLTFTLSPYLDNAFDQLTLALLALDDCEGALAALARMRAATPDSALIDAASARTLAACPEGE